MTDDTAVALARLEERVNATHDLSQVYAKGYIDSEMKSVLANQKATLDAMESRVKWMIRLQWIAVAIIGAAAFGIRFPLAGP